MSLALTVRKRRGLIVAVLAGALLTSACGLKPEVKEKLAQSGGAGGTTGGLAAAAGGVDAGTGGTTGGLGTAAGGTTGTLAGGTAGGTSGGTSGSFGTTGGSGGTSGAGSSTGGSGSSGTSATGGNAAAPVQGQGTTTGIDFKNKVINIVIHGPLTGAGVPQDSFKSGGPKYWDQSGPNGGPRLLAGGFKVNVEAVDDKYNAQDALRACNAAAKTAFLIIGTAGTDQIQACGQSQVLRRGNVPYISSGVTEAGLGTLPNYFANSMTYRQQSPLVIKMARDNNFLDKKWAVVITGTPNFADARESIVTELTKAGAKGGLGQPFNADKDVYLTEKAPNNCTDIANKLRAGQYESVYFLGQPLFFSQCVQLYSSPTYTGPGPSFGIQSVTDLACRTGAAGYHGFYLAPSPDKSTAQKAAAGAPAFKDDIESAIWAAMQSLEQAFSLVQGPLSRESFTAALAKKGTPGGVLNPAVYNGGSRFGGSGAYVNQLTCNGPEGVVKTIANYKK